MRRIRSQLPGLRRLSPGHPIAQRMPDMPDQASKENRLRQVLPPVMLISLAGLVGAVAGWFVVPISWGWLGAVGAAGGYGVGLILGVALARRILKK